MINEATYYEVRVMIAGENEILTINLDEAGVDKAKRAFFDGSFYEKTYGDGRWLYIDMSKVGAIEVVKIEPHKNLEKPLRSR